MLERIKKISKLKKYRPLQSAQSTKWSIDINYLRKKRTLRNIRYAKFFVNLLDLLKILVYNKINEKTRFNSLGIHLHISLGFRRKLALFYY